MKMVRLLAALLSLVPAAALAQSDGVATFKITMRSDAGAANGDRPAGTLKLGFSKTAARMDMEIDMSSMARNRSNGARLPSKFTMTSISKFAEPDKVYVLDDAQKTYSVMDVGHSRAEAARPDETWSVQRTGRDTIAGISCDKAMITSSKGTTIETCVATELPISSAWWAAVNRRKNENNFWIKAMIDAGLKGFPIRTRYISSKGAGGVDMELVRFDRQALPASAFQIPAGYKEEKAGGIPGMTAEQQKAMRDALANMTPEQRKAYEDAMKKAQSQ